MQTYFQYLLQLCKNKTGKLLGSDVERFKREDSFWMALHTLRLLLIYPLQQMQKVSGPEVWIICGVLRAIGILFIWPWLGFYEIFLAMDIRELGTKAFGLRIVLLRCALVALPALVMIAIPTSHAFLGMGYYCFLGTVGWLTGNYYMKTVQERL